jgi:predicted HicB family RNase H-like nuclease
MKRVSFSQRIVANIAFSERQPERDGSGEPVNFQMPEGVYRLFVAEARRRHTDLNTLVRDVICDALTERAEAIRHINAELDSRGSK